MQSLRRPRPGAPARRVLSHVLLAAGLGSALASAPAGAAKVTLHVQAPYDLGTRSFNLEDLEIQNFAPVYQDAFLVPYALLEARIAEELRAAVDRELRFHVRCATIFCPDTDVAIRVRTTFAFTKKDQPTISQLGPASDNALRVQLATQAAVGLTIDVRADTGIWNSADMKLEIHALLGVQAAANVTLWPTLDASDVTVKLSHDGGNIDITGLTSEAVELGVKVGAVLGALPGALLGGILGKVSAAKAEKKIKQIINEIITTEVIKANAMLGDAARKQISPKIAKARALKDELMTTPILGVNRSLAELMALAGIALDVRTVAEGGDIRAVVTTRFNPVPMGKLLRGAVRFPKTRCISQTISNPKLGPSTIPLAVEAINQGLAGKSCAALLTPSAFRRAAYLGEDPAKLLGGAGNHLPSWIATGSVSTTGAVVDAGDYYECPYTISNLPASAILELGVAAGSELSQRLDVHAFHARFLYLHVGGLPLLLDAKGKPLDPLALNFGGASPTTVEQCPSSSGSGKPLSLPKGFDVPARYDPNTCPMCGVIEVWNHLDTLTRPGDWARVYRGARLDKALDAARKQSDLLLGALPLQRAGLTATPRAVRGGKALAELPVVDIEVLVEGRGAGRNP